MKKIYLCRMCNTLYLNGRPFVCHNCNRNVLIKEIETTEKEIKEYKAIENLNIVEEEIKECRK